MGRFDRELILDPRVRAAGPIPLARWFFHFVCSVFVVEHLGNMLWVCHGSTLLLAIALFVSSTALVRVGAMWAIGGFPAWLLDVIVRTDLLHRSPCNGS